MPNTQPPMHGFHGLGNRVARSFRDDPGAPGLADLIPAAYFVTDESGLLLFANTRLALLLGYRSLDEMAADAKRTGNVSEFYPEDAPREDVLSLLRDCGTVRDHPIALLRLDGSLARCALSATLRRAEPGQPGLIEGFMVDRTEQYHAVEALVETLRLHSGFLDLLPEAAILHDDGRILQANAQAATFFEAANRYDMAGRQIRDLIHPDSVPILQARRAAALAETAGISEAEDDIRLPSGRTRHVLGRTMSERLLGQRVFLSIFMDQTLRREAEQGLGLARQRLQDILYLAPLGFAACSREAGYREVNQHFALMHGYASPEQMQEEVRDIAGQSFARPKDCARLRRRLEAQGLVNGFECLARRRDGSLFWTSRNARLTLSPDGLVTGFEDFVLDIDGRKRAEKEAAERERKVRALALDLLLATERERRQMAQELHDGPLQLLALAQMLLEQARQKPAPRADDLDPLTSLLGQCSDMLRSSLVELCPPALFEKGLADMLRHLGDEFALAHGLETTVDCQDLPALTTEAKAFLYRAARELLINTVKHGKASRAVLQVCLLDKAVVLEVDDNGLGLASFLPGPGSTRLGLPSLRQRAKDLGGGLFMHSIAGTGATVRLVLPLDALAEARPKAGDDSLTRQSLPDR